LRIGIVVAKNVNNETYQTGLEEDVSKEFGAFAQKYESVKFFEDEKNITAWREVYRSFGVNPKKKKPTAESLLTRVIKSGYVPHISPAVDAYLTAEIIACLPVGGYDLERLTGDIYLKFSQGGEEFFGVGAETAESTTAGEVIYADSERVLTRCWNYRDSDYTKIDTGTKTLALFAEAPYHEITDDEVNDTMKAIADKLEKFCSAECTILFLGKDRNEIDIF